MPLEAGGIIRMSQINTELGRSSTAFISLNTAEDGGYGAINQNSTSRPSSSNPATMGEWRGYNHSAAGCPPYGTYQFAYCDSSCNYWYRYADGACGFYDQLITVCDQVNCGFFQTCDCGPRGGGGGKGDEI